MTRVISLISPQLMLPTSTSKLFQFNFTSCVVFRFFRSRSSTRFYCKLPYKYRVEPKCAEAFARKMDVAGIKPHHRIAMGVSGGADSMALCVLMAHWKTCASDAPIDSLGFINGLLAITVDHGLRLESKVEAETASHWVSDMGVKCEIICCDWPNGLPKVGHLEEEARDMRYQVFQDACFRNQIGILLTAHHSDDQAELFVLRLSRNSGVLGLAGMAFTSQIFPKLPYVTGDSLNNQGILLVRPLLEFTKEDLYKICETNNSKWVEDPSNRSSLYARNRIRMALQDLNNCALRSELQALIASCRQTRSYVGQFCQILLNQAVTIMPYGYAVIDLESLNPSEREDICLSRFLALLLQFISQRHRPVRGSALKLLLDYIQTFPCKTSLTVAGCYLCAAPGTKGAKVLVCCSVDTALPSKTELYSTNHGQGLKQCSLIDVEELISTQNALSKRLVLDASDVHFLDSINSDLLLAEARKLGILSDSAFEFITELKMKEKGLFESKTEGALSNKSRKEAERSCSVRKPFLPGQSCYFMHRFFLTWMSAEESRSCNNALQVDDQIWHQNYRFCMADDKKAYIRHMIQEDWLYLAKLSQSLDLDKLVLSAPSKGMEQATNLSPCSDYLRSTAQQALKILKSIPVAARRSLPVVVSEKDIILSIPTIGFRHCPSMMISAEFRPRVPLGGGHSSFM